MVKNLHAMLETWVQSSGQEDPPEKGMSNHPSILDWKIPWKQSTGSQRDGHYWVTNINMLIFIIIASSISFLFFTTQACIFRHYSFILPVKRIKNKSTCLFSSVQFSRSVVSDSLRPHESQHARPPCSSPTPRVHSDSHPSSWWCHLAISSSVVPFSSCPQSLPASESFPMSHLFTWGGQSTRVSALASFLPMNTQDWSPLGWTGWISLQSKGLQKHQFFGAQLSLQSNSHIHTWPQEKT